MEESRPKLSESCPSVIIIEDDEPSNKSGNTTASVTGRSSTVPVKAVSETDDHAKTGSKLSSDYFVKMATHAIECAEPIDDIKGKRNKNNKMDIINNHDVIADIAASSHFRSRAKKRERNDNSTTSQQTAPTSNHILMTSHPPIIVTASMSNHYFPPRLQIGTGSLNNNAFTRTESNDKKFAGCSNGHKNKVSVNMLNSVGLECGDDGMLLLERFDDDDNASICANEVDSVGPIKTEDETGEYENTILNKKQKPPMWTLEQHKDFTAAIFETGLKNCSPSIIMENMRKKPIYITRERTKSHLQKYRQTKERSKGEFFEAYNAFFKSCEQAKTLLNSKNSNSSAVDNDKSIGTNKNFEHKEPIPKAILTMVLEGRKPSRLLGGKAAALLSYSVLNGFSTSHGPDQLQYKAAKFSEFPSLTEEEKRSSVGASLLQVKSLIDNMTDILLKTRHGIKPFPVRGSRIWDDESVSSSVSSYDYEYSDEDNIEGNGTVDKHLIHKTDSKDQGPMTAATAAPKNGELFPKSAGPVGPAHPLYRGPPTAYPAPFPTQGVPPSSANIFPPPQYPHTQPLIYGGAPPPPYLQPAAAPGFGAPAGFHHPQMHYAHDPRINPYQQAHPVQVGSYPGVPPMQPNYYPAVAAYPAYYGSASEGSMNPAASNAGTEYPPHPHASGNAFVNYTGHGGDGQQQRPIIYDQQSSSYSNDGRSDKITYDMDETSTEKRDRRRAEKRSERRRFRDARAEMPSSLDTSDLERTSDSDFGDFLDRLSEVPSASKSSRKPSPSPIQRSRRHRRSKSSPPLQLEDSPMNKPTRKRSRQLEDQKHQSQQQQYQPQFDTAVQSNSYADNFGSPETNNFSDKSPDHCALSKRAQSRAHVDQQQDGNNNGQFWESSNFVEGGYSNHQQPQNAGGRDFRHQPAPIDSFLSGSELKQQQNHRSCDDDRQYTNVAESTTNYFYGE